MLLSSLTDIAREVQSTTDASFFKKLRLFKKIFEHQMQLDVTVNLLFSMDIFKYMLLKIIGCTAPRRKQSFFKLRLPCKDHH